MSGESKQRVFRPDLDEFREMQAAWLKRAALHGVSAAVACALAVTVFMSEMFGEDRSWMLLLLSMGAGLGALGQLLLLWLERPTLTSEPVTLEIGQGLLRFINDDAGTVEEVRWRADSTVSVRRKSNAVEVAWPSGRRATVPWFAYSERDHLLRELLALDTFAELQRQEQAAEQASLAPEAAVEEAAKPAAAEGASKEVAAKEAPAEKPSPQEASSEPQSEKPASAGKTVRRRKKRNRPKNKPDEAAQNDADGSPDDDSGDDSPESEPEDESEESSEAEPEKAAAEG